MVDRSSGRTTEMWRDADQLRAPRMPRAVRRVVDELFLAGTTAELTPILPVDRIEVGEGRPGSIARVWAEYLPIAGGQAAGRHAWLGRHREPAGLPR